MNDFISQYNDKLEDEWWEDVKLWDELTGSAMEKARMEREAALERERERERERAVQSTAPGGRHGGRKSTGNGR